MAHRRGKGFSLLQDNQIDCGSHSAAYSVSTMVLPGVLRPGCDDHSSPASAELTHEWSSISVLSTRLDSADRDFTSLFQCGLLTQ